MDKFKIYVDRLKNAHTEKVHHILPPAFLEVNETDLQFPEDVHVEAEAYLADEHLVIHLSAKTAASLPCLICNDPVSIPINVKNHYHSEPLEEIPGGVFDLAKEIREAILLHIPQFAECNHNNCPKRNAIKSFLKSPSPQKKEDTSATTYFPFAGLDTEKT